jgi:hypothetical protein
VLAPAAGTMRAVPDQVITEIVDELFLPLAVVHPM